MNKYKMKFYREYKSLFTERKALETEMSNRQGIVDILYYKGQIDLINEKIKFWEPIFGHMKVDD